MWHYPQSISENFNHRIDTRINPELLIDDYGEEQEEEEGR